MVNWTTVAIGFVVTIVLEIVGLLFKSVDMAVATFISIFAPIIGGLIAAYWAGGTFKDGAINGGLAGGLGSLLAAIISTPGNFILLVENSIISFVISGIAGSIGGLIGVLAKSNRQDNEKNMKE
ncbi:MAG: DUF5518 domain-containing protein [Euryarchaeota archaeon]|jgi:hypothetical protein|uniref:DUF5518 domain-containing protein n=1 Tax=Methanobacterium sp. MZD130B TaxID=3394378 RepID=UPI0017787707|nr:DUF5518 domain-containing protein [Euryarchaeota archaeon]HHT19615.1 DUF5518 domain-containing protein [Methanobacterium sp.]